MRMLDYNEFKMCQILGDTFEISLEYSHLSSPMFIKRFMMSDEAKCYFDKSYLILTCNKEDVILDLNDKYSATKNAIHYSKDEMYWIGYIYGALSYLYNLSAKQLFELFPGTEIVKYYLIYHTFSIEDAAERMMDNIGYKVIDNTKKGVEIFRRLMNM